MTEKKAIDTTAFSVASALQEGRPTADIMAERAAAILDRKQKHHGPFIYVLVLGEHPHWGPVDSIWCGNELVWKTGAKEIADYCVQQYERWMQTRHHAPMLERGWIAVRDLRGEIVEWRDPTEPRNVWPDWEAKLFHEAGDCGSVPPLRRPSQLEEA